MDNIGCPAPQANPEDETHTYYSKAVYIELVTAGALPSSAINQRVHSTLNNQVGNLGGNMNL